MLGALVVFFKPFFVMVFLAAEAFAGFLAAARLRACFFAGVAFLLAVFFCFGFGFFLLLFLLFFLLAMGAV